MDETSAVKLDRDVLDGLEEEARRQDSSADHVANAALRYYLDRQAHFRRSIEAAAAEADKGVFISREAMMGWVKDLFDGKKSPPPKPDVFFPPRSRS